MNKRSPGPRDSAKLMELRARLHFETLQLINRLELAERNATPEQFAIAARVTASIVSNAQIDWRRSCTGPPSKRVPSSRRR
jgi:hypothetical protein